MWTFNLLMLFVMAGHSQLEVNISSFFTSSLKTARTFSLIILDVVYMVYQHQQRSHWCHITLAPCKWGQIKISIKTGQPLLGPIKNIGLIILVRVILSSRINF